MFLTPWHNGKNKDTQKYKDKNKYKIPKRPSMCYIFEKQGVEGFCREIYRQEIFLLKTRSLGALRAPTSSWGPFGPRLLVGGPSGPDF